jgi:hypothetical protein
VKTILRLLQFLCITGPDNNISLTNLLMISIVVKFLLVRNMTAVDLASAAVAIAPYLHRRHFHNISNVIGSIVTNEKNVLDNTPKS